MERTSVATATSAGQRRPGRPARVTSEQIVAAAAALIRDDPDSKLTMAKVAAAVDVTPMALYRHFKDRDALLDEVVSAVLRERNAAIPRTGPWQDQLRAWIKGGFEHLVPYAQVVRFVMAGGSFRWMHDAATLARILEAAGFEGRELAETQLWIATSVGGFVMAYAERPRSSRVSEMYAALAQLDDDDARRVGALIPDFEQAYADMYESFTERMVETVELFAARRKAGLAEA
jgi:AcrR family transcriptional regulator